MDNIISLEHVSKRLGHRMVLKDVSLAVYKGDIFGFLGPNGAGKTTSIRIMLGLFLPDTGKAVVLGRDSREDNVRQKIGFVLETDGLYDNLTAFDNLLYYGRIYDLPQMEDRIIWAVKTVGLEDRIRDKVGAYSKGMRQRLALARAILHNPDVLILDEPTAGVDPSGQIEIRQIMLDLVHKQGKTVLLSSHNLDEVQRICNRIALIHQGEIRLYGEKDKLQREMSHGEMVIETSEPVPAAALAELMALPGVSLKAQESKVLTLAIARDAEVTGIVSLLAARGVGIEQVKKQTASLEEIYTTILKEAGSK